MSRYFTRRLQRLETRAKEIAEARPPAHTICFVDMNRKVVRTFDMANGKWTHFDPPRDRAEFEPIV
jgi:hypothetical protein